jgi:hypothetical protein
MAAVESGGSRHAQLHVVHMSARVGHAPASNIYLQACVGHAPARGGWMGKLLVAKQSKESPYHCGVARVVAVKLHEVDISDFEKKNQI